MGFRGRYRNKRDASEPDIVATLEAVGIRVERIDTPVDLLALYGGEVRLVEVKSKGGKLTKSQERFLETWPVAVLRSVEDAEKWAMEVRNGLG